ncbi:hypothetical protein N7537_010174 [Penicillium hordei]|uniref:Uncharacterized protein n=1 Tax=Penicillium hordei TaxID=40994 RepID=A0AAD6DU53_9EURO|nr:uncharacterized protein N7537_010174 [Penicillium hordei]KAJ5593270.1 hypothetical protein N7537_010174 [Penicillium hordei]
MGLSVTCTKAHGQPRLLPPMLRSNINLRLPEIFSNNASDSNSSTVSSVFDLSSESESESKDKSEDKLALEDKEKIKRGSKITGFAEVAKLYYLRYSVFAYLISRSINPYRPYRLKDSSYIKDIPHIHTLEDRK